MITRRHLIAIMGSGLLALTLNHAQAAPYAFEEGIHYKKLPEQARSVVSKGTLQEFFFYGCPHCQHMEEPLHKWLAQKPSHIQFEAVPAVFQSPAWATLARIHYALKQTQQLRLHDQVFTIFLQDKARPKNQNEIADLLYAKDNTFDKTAFLTAYDSEAVTQAVTRAAQLSGQYQLDAVPTFVINGRYVTDLPMAGTYDKLFSLIEILSQQ